MNGCVLTTHGNDFQKFTASDGQDVFVCLAVVSIDLFKPVVKFRLLLFVD
jgi:hypothetical protein